MPSKIPKLHKPIYKMIKEHINDALNSYAAGNDRETLEHYIDATRKFKILFEAGEGSFDFSDSDYMDSLFDDYETVLNNLGTLRQEGHGNIKVSVGTKKVGGKLRREYEERPIYEIAGDWHDRCYKVAERFIDAGLKSESAKDFPDMDVKSNLWALKCNLYNDVLEHLLHVQSSKAPKIYAKGLRACNDAVSELPADELDFFIGRKLALHSEMGPRSFFYKNSVEVTARDNKPVGDEYDVNEVLAIVLDPKKPTKEILSDFNDAHKVVSRGMRDIKKICKDEDYWALFFKADQFTNVNSLFDSVDDAFLERIKNTPEDFAGIKKKHKKLLKDINKAIKD